MIDFSLFVKHDFSQATMPDSRSKYSINVSTEPAEKLASIVDEIDFENDQIVESDKLNDEISKFLSQKLNITSIVQIQSYCATTNDHHALASITNNFRSLIQYCNHVGKLHEFVKPLIEDIISLHNIKVFYRCLTNEHSALITIPALKLLTEIVSFNNGVFVDQFLESFDLTIKSLSNLFTPTKTSLKLKSQGKYKLTIRYYMSLFWISLCSNASCLTRNDLLINNKNINSNWFKYMYENDNTEILLKTIKFIDDKILNEKSFRKMTKCKLLGNNKLANLVELYKIDEIKDEVHALMLKITTDEENGLLYHDSRLLFNKIPNSLNSGVEIKINEIKFKINNKIIYSILTSLSPWSNSQHLKLIIETLKNANELIAPYTTYLFQHNGNHDPKLTSFYIGQSLLLTKIIELPIPQEFIQSTKQLIDNNNINGYLSSKIIMESICPIALNRSSLTKGLSSDSSLIKHITSLLIISILNKYNKFEKLFKYKENESDLLSNLRTELRDLLIDIKLPNQSVFIGNLNECIKASNVNKLLLLNYLKCIELFNSVLNINLPVQISSINEIINLNDKLSDLDILIFNSYLTITANDSISNNQNKWWNVAKGSKNTMFTTFTKLPYDLQFDGEFDTSLVFKIVDILTNFVDDMLVFEDYKLNNTLVLYSQALAIVLSTLKMFNKYPDAIDTICKILDESISRSVKTPYKYIDQIANYKSKVSVFYIVLIEQSKFAIEEHKEYVKEWINEMTKYLFLIGEPLDTMKSISDDVQLSEATYEDSLTSGDFKINVDMLAFTPVVELHNVINNMIFKSDIQIVIILSRLYTIMKSNIELNKVEDLIIDLVSTYGNYVINVNNNDEDEGISLLSKKYWIRFFEIAEGNDDKQRFIIKLLNEVFKEVWKKSSTEFKQSLRDVVSTLKDDDFIWVLSDDQLKEMLTNKGSNYEAVLDVFYERKLKLDNDSIIKICENVENASNMNKFIKLCENITFSDDQIYKLIEFSKSSTMYYDILKNIDNPIIFEEVDKLFDTVSKTTLGFQFLQNLAIKHEEFREGLFNIAISKINEMIETGNFETLNIYLGSILLDGHDSSEIIQKLINFDQVRNSARLIFSCEMTEIIIRLFTDETLKIWLSRAVLYITKMFAESVNELDDAFLLFIEKLQNLKVSVWKYVSKDMLNSQLEVILTRPWIKSVDVIKYCLWVIDNGSKNIVECVRLTNMVFNNKDLFEGENELQYYTILMISKLITYNIKELSTFENIQRILKLYRCTNKSSDLAIKDLLIQIETETGESWVKYVCNWEFIEGDDQEEEDGEFIINTPDGLVVNLYKNMINKSIEKFQPILRNIETRDIELKKMDETVYDIEFLLLLIINNEELFRFEDEQLVVNLQALISTSLLQLIICGLAFDSEQIKDICKRIISSIILSLEIDIKNVENKSVGKFTFRERSIFKVYLGNLLFTLENTEVSKLFIIMLSHLVPVLSNPGHFLYEKACRYILGGSKYREFEIPMYKTIMTKFVKDEYSSEEDSDYYKESKWLLETLSKCITDSSDLKLLIRNGVIEDLLNLKNSVYNTNSALIDLVLSRILETENGADLLVRSYGMLSFNEGKALAIKTIIASDCNAADKRGREWSGDYENIVKRVKNV